MIHTEPGSRKFKYVTFFSENTGSADVPRYLRYSRRDQKPHDGMWMRSLAQSEVRRISRRTEDRRTHPLTYLQNMTYGLSGGRASSFSPCRGLCENMRN